MPAAIGVGYNSLQEFIKFVFEIARQSYNYCCCEIGRAVPPVDEERKDRQDFEWT
jgi:hypothetical protein